MGARKKAGTLEARVQSSTVEAIETQVGLNQERELDGESKSFWSKVSESHTAPSFHLLLDHNREEGGGKTPQDLRGAGKTQGWMEACKGDDKSAKDFEWLRICLSSSSEVDPHVRCTKDQ